MREVSHIFKKGGRLLDEAKREFPEYSAFTEYLALRVREANGSIEVIRILCEYLKMAAPDPSPVTLESIVRLAVERNAAQTTRVYQELSRHGVDSLGLSMSLSLRLCGTIHVGDAKIGRHCTGSMNQAVDRDHVSDYAAIFICALAMLTGLEMDPRDEAT